MFMTDLSHYVLSVRTLICIVNSLAFVLQSSPAAESIRYDHLDGAQAKRVRIQEDRGAPTRARAADRE